MRRHTIDPETERCPFVCQCGNVRSSHDGEVLGWGNRIGSGIEWVHRRTLCGPPAGPGKHTSKAQLFPDQLHRDGGRHRSRDCSCLGRPHLCLWCRTPERPIVLGRIGGRPWNLAGFLPLGPLGWVAPLGSTPSGRPCYGG